MQCTKVSRRSAILITLGCFFLTMNANPRILWLFVVDMLAEEIKNGIKLHAKLQHAREDMLSTL